MDVREASVVHAAEADAGVAVICTDWGEIPADWSVVEIGRIALSVRSGKTRDWRPEGPFPTYGSTGVIGHCDFADYSGPSILVARVGANAGKLNTVDGSYGVTDNTIILRIGVQWSLAYIHRQLECRSLNSLSFGSGQPLITGSQLKQLSIAVPPAPEQQAIAEALSDADALIESLSLLLAKKRQIKQGAMQELLTGRRRLPGFYMAWVASSLGRLGRTYGGLIGKTKSDFGQGQARYITFMNVMTNVAMDARQTQVVDIKLGEAQNSVSIGDLLFNGSSETPEEVALCSYVAEEAGPLYLNSFCFGFRPHERDAFCGLFMAYFFRSRPGRRAVSALAQGATRYNISKTALLQASLHLPSTDEQRAIVEVLSSLDVDIAVLELRIAKARQLKKGMMQALLTGRIRLVQPASNIIPRPPKPAAAQPPPPPPAHNWQINEAVVIGVLAQRFGSEQFPLPRKRRVKLMYLLHRHAEGRAEGYLKKAAGPYDPNTKYKGPEAIALKNGYVRALHNGTYEGFVAGDKAEQAHRYFEQWYGTAALGWLERFNFRKTDELELLATVDMALVDLAAAGQPADVAGVKRVIAAHPEWVPKLSRELFSDENIARAIAERSTLFTA